MVVTVFHDVRLPDDVERGAQGGPRFSTTVVPLFGGFEQRNINWQSTRGEWDVGYGIQSQTAVDVIIAFFYARNGRAIGFRFKDWSDFNIVTGQIGLGDDVTTVFQVVKVYSSGGFTHSRTIRKIVVSTYTVFLEGTPVPEGAGPGKFTIDINTGLVTMGTAPLSTGGSGPGGEEILTITTEFDVPVRFDTDSLEVSGFIFSDDFKGSVPRIPIVEIRPKA